MKSTFAEKTFFIRSFRPATLAGPVQIKYFKPQRAATFTTGAAAAQTFLAGAKIGQLYNAGATAGICHA
jgi:hypothetical protein